MKTFLLNERTIRKGSLILVNAAHPLPENERLEQEERLPPHPGYPEITLQKQAANMLYALLHYINGFQAIVPVSGYRTLAEQTEIYAQSIQEHGETFTSRYVALPGCSEHQTGLAIDLAKADPQIDFICPSFPYDGLFQTFRKIAARYGFVERYGTGKEHITKIAAEPWHFRYVGYPHAILMKKMGFSLEEYISHLQSFPQDGAHWKEKINRCSFELFHVPIQSGETISLHLPENVFYFISGDNDKGGVVALWREFV